MVFIIMKTITLSEKSINKSVYLCYTILKSHGVNSLEGVTIKVNDGILSLTFTANTRDS